MTVNAKCTLIFFVVFLQFAECILLCFQTTNPGGGGGATPYTSPYGEAPPEKVTFFRLQVY